jgi:hypothetical protein
MKIGSFSANSLLDAVGLHHFDVVAEASDLHHFDAVGRRPTLYQNGKYELNEHSRLDGRLLTPP